MQTQFQKRFDLLKVKNANHNPTKVKKAVAALCQPLTVNRSGLRVFEQFAGTGAILKAFNNSCLGQVVGCAERDPLLHDYLKHLFPDARAIRNARTVTAALLTQLRVDVFAAGPPCPKHSQANVARTGNASAEGQEYENVADPMMEAFQGRGCPVGLFECVEGVTDRIKKTQARRTTSSKGN